MKKIFASLIVAAAIAPLYSQSRDIITYDNLGFSIGKLEEAAPVVPGMKLVMLIGSDEDFAPNINVIIQKFEGTIQGYVEISETGLKEKNFEIISAALKGDEYIVEYRGDMNGKVLRFYSRAVKKKDLIYLVTATAKESQWEKNSGKLKETADSMKVK